MSSGNGYDEPVGIHLLDGPHAGWNQIYSGNGLGGWPLPDRIAAFPVSVPTTNMSPVIAVARAEKVPPDYVDKVSWYVKVSESKMEAPAEGWVRGAAYEAEK